jgi:hypothetical protein
MELYICTFCGFKKPATSFQKRSGKRPVQYNCRDCKRLQRDRKEEYIKEKYRQLGTLCIGCGIPKQIIHDGYCTKCLKSVKGLKKCIKCKDILPIYLSFYPHKSACKNCSSKKYKGVKETFLLKTYGINLDAYNELKEAQSNKCAICKAEPTQRELAIDHDHKTGKIRGLLCLNCNVGISYFKDNPFLLQQAISYLLQASAQE